MSQAARAASMSRARSWVSQVKPSPIARQVTRSGNPASTVRSPVPQAPLTNCTMPTRMPWPIARSTIPKAAVVFPLPEPVWTIRSPRSSVLVASTRRRAAWRRSIFSRCRRLISSSVRGSLIAHQLRAHAVARGMPQPALDRLAKAAPCLAERRRVVRRHETLDRIVAEIGVVQRLEMRIVDRAGRRGEGEQIIDRRGDLCRALVAVPHHALDPARVGGAAAYDAADFLAQGADARPVGLRMIIVVDRRVAPRQMPHGEREPALELIVIVAVEEVVLAIVLVVDDGVGRSEARFEESPFGAPLAAGAIGPLAPTEIGIGQIALVLPDPLVDQGLQAGAIGPGHRAKNPVAGAQRGLVRGDAGGGERRAVGGDARG